MIQIPPYLQPGDTIGIVSTASIIDRDVIEPAIALLKQLGYQVILATHLFERHHQFAGTDQQRAADLQNMLDNPNIKAIICSRGGYGSLRTAELINWDKFSQNPKWLIGFSDVTVFHSKLNLLQIASIHGVMPRYFLKDNQTSESFRLLHDALSGKNLSYQVEPSIYNRVGQVTAPIIGGNLSILYSLRGTPYDIDTNGKILFIEDLAEYLYHLDRIMLNLKVGGKLEKLAGLVVGHFTGMKDHENSFGKNVEEIITDAVKNFHYPVLFNFQAGHEQNNYPLKFGVEATLHVNINSTSILTQKN